METDKRNQALITKRCNQTAICPPTFLTRLMTVATCLLLCLASCSSEEPDTLPDGGNYPLTGKRIPLRFAGAGMATYSTSIVDTRNGSFNGLTPIGTPQTRATTSSLAKGTLFKLYVYTKDPDPASSNKYLLTCSSQPRLMDTLQHAPLYYYEGSTIRIIAVWNGANTENASDPHIDVFEGREQIRGMKFNHLLEQLEGMPQSPAWGSAFPVDLSMGANFMVYDSGDITTKTYLAPIQIMFRYYTSQIVLFVGLRSDTKITSYRERALATKGTWYVGDPDITESARNNGQLESKNDNDFSGDWYKDDKYATILNNMSRDPNSPYIEYPVISMDLRAFDPKMRYPYVEMRFTFSMGAFQDMKIAGPSVYDMGYNYDYALFEPGKQYLYYYQYN